MVVISVLLTCLILQKSELQAIFTEILDSFNNPNEKVFSVALGAIARIVTDCKSEDSCGICEGCQSFNLSQLI